MPESVDRPTSGTIPRRLIPVAARLTDLVLRLSGLPSVPLAPIGPRTAAAFEAVAHEHVDAATADGPVPTIEVPGDVVPFLRWLRSSRDVQFHGSKEAELQELSTERKSTDAYDFGSQQAVFASDDPLWAMFFGLLQRGAGFHSTRNGSMASVSRPDRRRYFLSVNHDEEFVVSPGFIYVLPGATFRVEPPWSGVLSTAQWVSTAPVRPYFRLAVDPSDYPLTKHIIRHNSGDPMLRTIWKSRVKRAR